jgi:hypothetical protein
VKSIIVVEGEPKDNDEEVEEHPSNKCDHS